MEISMVRKISTYVKYRFIYDKYLALVLRDHKVTDIDSTIIERNISKCTSESVQKSIYCVLNQILRFASKHYEVSITIVKRQVLKGKRKPVEVLSKLEQSQLFTAIYCNMDIYKLAVAFSLYTGVRIGELCALKWMDVDLDNRLVSINRTVQRVSVDNEQTKTKLLETVPKSDCSRREIPISVSIYNTLDGQIAHKIEFGQRYQSVAVNDNFANPEDNILALNEDGTMLGVSFADGSLQIYQYSP